jgi:hypothetical protein
VLNMILSEPLSLVQELPFFENLIKMDPLLSSSLDLCVHNMIIGCMFHAFKVDLCSFQFFFYF